MATPDPLHLRGYNSEVKRHRKNALFVLKSIESEIARLRTDVPGESLTIALGDAQRLAADAIQLVKDLSAWKALDDVSFLTTDPDER